MCPSIRPTYLEQLERRTTTKADLEPIVLRIGLVSDRRGKEVELIVYGGAMGIGGNKIYLEENGNGVFLERLPRLFV